MEKSQITGIFVQLNEDGSIDLGTDAGKALVYGAFYIGKPRIEYRENASNAWDSVKRITKRFAEAVKIFQFRLEPEHEVQFPEIGADEEWHNPSNQSPFFFGSHNGWRPALKSEFEAGITDKDMWEVYYPDSMQGWYLYNLTGKPSDTPLRTKKQLPESATKIEDTYIEATNEDSVEVAFHKLAEQWKRETGMQSLMGKRYSHPAYHGILALGPVVIPYILAELPKKNEHWWEALRVLSKESPAEHCTSFQAATEIWLDWGEKKGLYARPIEEVQPN